MYPVIIGATIGIVALVLDARAAKRDEDNIRHNIRRENASKKELQMERIADKFEEIRHHERLARDVCKKATNSACGSATDYIHFSKLYATSRVHQGGYINRPWRGALFDADTKSIDAYRNAFNSFYCRTYTFGMDRTMFRGRPQAGDFESFLTLHWVNNMSNTICAKKTNFGHHITGPVYDNALTELKTLDNAAYDRVQSIHTEVCESFLKTQHDLFGGREDNKGISSSNHKDTEQVA